MSAPNHIPEPPAQFILDSPIQRLLDRPLSHADLAAGSEWAARRSGVHERQTLGLLLFRIGSETAAVQAGLLRRVTTWARPTPIPRRSGGVLRGICNIQGQLVLCADLRKVLEIPEQPGSPSSDPSAPDRRRMVVIGSADEPWVFEVDSLIGFERVTSEAIRPPPVTVELALGAFTTGIATVHGEQVTLLDGARLLSGFKAGLA